MTEELLTLEYILSKKGLTIEVPLISEYDTIYTVPWHALDILCGEEKDNFTYEQVINFNWEIFSDNPGKIIRSAMVNYPPMKTWHKYCNQPSKMIDLYNNSKDKIKKNEDKILNDID